jgi:hypothetical protein
LKPVAVRVSAVTLPEIGKGMELPGNYQTHHFSPGELWVTSFSLDMIGADSSKIKPSALSARAGNN